MIDSLTGYLDTMAAAAINGGSKFEQYAAKLTKLAKNSITLANTVDKQKNELTDLRQKIIPSRTIKRGHGTRVRRE